MFIDKQTVLRSQFRRRNIIKRLSTMIRFEISAFREIRSLSWQLVIINLNSWNMKTAASSVYVTPINVSRRNRNQNRDSDWKVNISEKRDNREERGFQCQMPLDEWLWLRLHFDIYLKINKSGGNSKLVSEHKENWDKNFRPITAH